MDKDIVRQEPPEGTVNCKYEKKCTQRCYQNCYYCKNNLVAVERKLEEEKQGKYFEALYK